jgi:hypothetical protein
VFEITWEMTNLTQWFYILTVRRNSKSSTILSVHFSSLYHFLAHKLLYNWVLKAVANEKCHVSLPFNGFFSLLIKQLWCESDHSLSSSFYVKNEGSYTSTPPIYLHSMYRYNICVGWLCTYAYSQKHRSLTQNKDSSGFRHKANTGINMTWCKTHIFYFL